MTLKNHGQPWIAEDIINLVELIEEDYNFESASIQLQRSKNACYTMYSFLRRIKKINPDSLPSIIKRVQFSTRNKQEEININQAEVMHFQH